MTDLLSSGEEYRQEVLLCGMDMPWEEAQGALLLIF
jgi:hypothetical protein